MYKTQVIVRRYDLLFLKSGLFQVNIQRSLETVYCLLWVTQLTVYKTQVILTRCDINMLRSDVFHVNSQRLLVKAFCLH